MEDVGRKPGWDFSNLPELQRPRRHSLVLHVLLPRSIRSTGDNWCLAIVELSIFAPDNYLASSMASTGVNVRVPSSCLAYRFSKSPIPSIAQFSINPPLLCPLTNFCRSFGTPPSEPVYSMDFTIKPSSPRLQSWRPSIKITNTSRAWLRRLRRNIQRRIYHQAQRQKEEIVRLSQPQPCIALLSDYSSAGLLL